MIAASSLGERPHDHTTDYGLDSSIWSADPAQAAALASRLDAGMTWINARAVAAVDQPFSGVKSSGVGVENGRWGMEVLTERHTVALAR